MADTAVPTSQSAMLALAGTILRKLLTVGGTGLATHGVINSNGVETFVSVGLAVAGIAWSFWNDYGRVIVLAKLDVWKATAQAQAEALHKANVPGPTAAQIADKIPDPAVTAQTVAKVMTAGCLLLAASLIALAGPAAADTVSVTVRVHVRTHQARPAPRVVYVPRPAPVFIPYFGAPERFPFLNSPMRTW